MRLKLVARLVAAWSTAAILISAAGCQRTAAKTGTPPVAPTGPRALLSPDPGAPSADEPAAASRVPDGAPAPTDGGPAAPSGDESTDTPPTTPGAEEPVPKPRVGKEIVIAWEASLMYLIKDGKLAGKPLILNGARREYLRPSHLGSFTITEKMRMKRSNLYDVNGDPLPDKKTASTNGARMGNWMRLGRLPVGLHYSPAFRFYRSAGARHRSHGCYRMSRRDSNMVFKWASIGTPVHVVRSLAGSEWEFLRAETPPELLPGYRSSKIAGGAKPRARRTHATSARRPAPSRPTATASKPGAPRPPAEATAATPRPAAQPVAGRPQAPSPDALQSGTPAATEPKPAPQQIPSPQPEAPAADTN